MWFCCLLCVIILLIFIKVKHSHDYWNARGVNGPKPLLFIGNMAAVLNRKCSFITYIIQGCKKYAQEKVIGIYVGLNPILIVNDPKLIESILVTDFQSFTNRGASVLGYMTGPLTRNLFFIDGTDWKILRTKLNPAFTSACLKKMTVGIVDYCISSYNKHLQKLLDDSKAVEVGDLNVRYVLKGLLSVVFGLNVDTYNEEDIFVKMARKTMVLDTRSIFYTIVHNVVPGKAFISYL